MENKMAGAITAEQSFARAISAVSAKRLTLFALFCLIEVILLTGERFFPMTLTPFMWFLLALAASLSGPAIAYLAIGEWLRWPLAKVVAHSSGVGEDTEPKYNSDGKNVQWFHGVLHAFGILITCPICSATWMGVILFTVMSVNEPIGRYMVYAFSVGGCARAIIRFTELLEMFKYKANEEAGYYHKMNCQLSQDRLFTR